MSGRSCSSGPAEIDMLEHMAQIPQLGGPGDLVSGL